MLRITSSESTVILDNSRAHHSPTEKSRRITCVNTLFAGTALRKHGVVGRHTAYCKVVRIQTKADHSTQAIVISPAFAAAPPTLAQRSAAVKPVYESHRPSPLSECLPAHTASKTKRGHRAVKKRINAQINATEKRVRLSRADYEGFNSTTTDG